MASTQYLLKGYKEKTPVVVLLIPQCPSSVETSRGMGGHAGADTYARLSGHQVGLFLAYPEPGIESLLYPNS